jgi:TldD protein
MTAASPSDLGEFGLLPVAEVRSAALERAEQLGCRHAEVRIEHIRSQFVALRDGKVETTVDDTEIGVGLRVVHNGSIGFAATVEVHPHAAAALAEEAVRLADETAATLGTPVELADEPAHGHDYWASPYEVDPAGVEQADKVALLEEWSGRLLAAGSVDHVTARVLAVVEDKIYADLSGTVTEQRRVRIHPVVEAIAVDESTGTFESMRTLAPPVGRGW